MADKTDDVAEPEFNILVDGAPLTIDLVELHETIYALMVTFRQLGFSADDLYFVSNLKSRNFPPDMDFYGVALRIGDEYFSISACPCDVVCYTVTNKTGDHKLFCPPEIVTTLWVAFVGAIQLPGREPDVEQERRMLRVQRDHIEPAIAGLRARGFAIPLFEPARAAEAGN